MLASSDEGRKTGRWSHSMIRAQIRVLAALGASPRVAADRPPATAGPEAGPGKGAHRGVPEMDDPDRMAGVGTADRWPSRGTDRSGAGRAGGHQGSQAHVHDRGGVRPVAVTTRPGTP